MAGLVESATMIAQRLAFDPTAEASLVDPTLVELTTTEPTRALLQPREWSSG